MHPVTVSAPLGACTFSWRLGVLQTTPMEQQLVRFVQRCVDAGEPVSSLDPALVLEGSDAALMVAGYKELRGIGAILPAASDADTWALVNNLHAVVQTLAAVDDAVDVRLAHKMREYAHLMYVELPEAATTQDLQLVLAAHHAVEAAVRYTEQPTGSVAAIVQEVKHVQALLAAADTLLKRGVTFDGAPRRFFRRWHHRWLALLEPVEFVRRRYLRAWLVRCRRTQSLMRPAAAYCDKIAVARAVSDFWIPKLIRCREMAARADLFRPERVWGRWRGRLEKAAATAAELARRGDAAVQRRCWGALRRRLREVESLKDKSAAFAEQRERKVDARVCAQNFERWRHKCLESTGGRTNGLAEKEWALLKGRFFFAWARQHRFWRLQVEFEEKKRSRRRDLVWRHWRESVARERQIREFGARDDVRVLCHYFGFWNICSGHAQQAEAFHTKQALTRSMALWRFAHSRTERLAQFDRRLLQKTWRLWVRSCDLSNHEKERDSKTKRLFLDRWRDRHGRVEALESSGLSFTRASTTKVAFRAWSLRLSRNEERTWGADAFTLKNKFHRWRNRHGAIQTLKSVQVDFKDKFVKTLYFQHWRRRLGSQKEARDYEKADHFVGQRNRLAAASAFSSWRQRHYETTQRNEELDELLADVLAATKSRYFAKWASLYDTNSERIEMSDAFYVKRLLGRALQLWHDAHQLWADINQEADDFAYKHEHYLLQEVVRKWHTKQAVITQRNSGMSRDLFERLTKKKAYAIFRLWALKSRRKRHSGRDAASPLARKGKSPRTPRFYTPARNAHSPSRLQETKERLRETDVDALIDRYKMLSVQRGPVRLVYSDLTHILPPRPRLSKAEESPPFGYQKLPSPQVDYDDPKVLSSAKKKRLIRPLALPPYERQPLSSPEKLHSAGSNVFMERM